METWQADVTIDRFKARYSKIMMIWICIDQEVSEQLLAVRPFLDS
jgi:hypothetical protein